MSGDFPAPPGAPVGEAAPAKVFRSELNPVDFLHRTAYLYPDKAAVVDGTAALWFSLAFERGMGRGVGFKVLTR